MSDSQLYEDTFALTSMNHQKYDRVGRVAGTSADNTTIMTLDVNTDLYPLQAGDNIQLLLASTLNLDGTKDDDNERGWREKRANEQTLADLWDYVCYGKVYKFEEGDDGEVM
jgi:DNA-directed RNA polymerase I, II, and III subunit RPABC3